MIEQVEGLGVKREAHAFADCEAAGERQVKGEQSRSLEDIPAGRTKMVTRRNGECRGVEPALGRGMVDAWIAQQVRTIRTEDAARISRVAVIGAQYRGEGLAGLSHRDAAHFRIPYPPRAAGQMINVRRGEA